VTPHSNISEISNQKDKKMNAEKLAKLQAQVRVGGKGTQRRKKKVVRHTATTDDKKLQSSLKKLSVNNIPGIEEVNMIKDDGSVIHFNNPKVQASLAANTFAVTGHAENKQITELLPGILNQLGAESLTHLKKLASNVTGGGAGAGLDGSAGGDDDDDDDDVPDLVENFDEVSKNEANAKSSKVTNDDDGDGDDEDDEKSSPSALPKVEPKVEPVEEKKDLAWKGLERTKAGSKAAKDGSPMSDSSDESLPMVCLDSSDDEA